ncbi:MAG: pyridoxamine 5'-phosphate oxidase family protein [Pseudomonadota bacterium]
MTNPPRSERPAMDAYGVVDDPTGLLPWSWAEERLLSCRNFWFVTVRPDGRPHSMPVWGAWMPDRQRWGVGCARSSQKVRNLAANPNVVVTVEDTVEAISIEGVAAPIEGADADPFIDAWVAKYASELGDFADGIDDDSAAQAAGFLREGAMFEVTPHHAIGMIERAEEFAERATRWVWA